MEEKLKKLGELTELFQSNIEVYKSQRYDESNTRTDFIDKFFKLLDWDIANKQGFSENYREVVREDKVVIEGKPKAPDYSFRIGGHKKFFVEAKKPSVNIKDDFAPAFQVRRYGYTAKLPLSILTDFEEFAVYDTRIKPNKNDKPATARLFYCNFKDYQKEFDFIYNTFSKNAILKGSFDKYIVENKTKKGTSEVDKEFLKLLEDWRNELAKNIAIRNKDLSLRELNHAVQVIIDRVIFLRIAEDRNIEEYQTLQKAAKKDNIYDNLKKIFVKADSKYNSGLFKADKFVSALKIDDKVLKPILSGLYYPDCPYEFSQLGVEILGSIYEQFLGKTIRLTSGHQAKVEEKPEVRKAGGVYYTPQYIVEYIVKNTVGEKIKDKTTKEVSEITICDPACGSGSFLLGAYDYLLKWHLEYYTQDKNLQKARKEDAIYQVEGGDYRLSIWEKRRILLNNIYGVDIDSQAVEVTKLSLLLKMMEGETEESTHKLALNEGLLPNLENNIKCGNSLIGTDFYMQGALFDDEQNHKINAFDWEAGFPKVFANGGLAHRSTQGEGGFDVVIGNPPWGADIDDQVDYFIKKYPNSTKRHKDTYKIFIDRALQILKNQEYLGFIVPNTFLYQPRYIDTKEMLESYNCVVLNLGEKIFDAVSLPSCILIMRKISREAGVFDIDLTKEKRSNLSEIINTIDIEIEKNKKEKWKNIVKKTGLTFDDVFIVKDAGVKHQRVGVGKQEKGKSDLRERIYSEVGNKNDHPLFVGSDIERYSVLSQPSFFLREDYKKILKKNEIVYFDKNMMQEASKIIWRQTAECIKAVLIGRQWFANTLQSAILKERYKQKVDILYALAIFNSKYVDYIYRKKALETGRVFPQVKLGYLRDLPFILPSKGSQEKIVALVDQMLETQKKLHSAKLDSDVRMYKQQAEILDKKIDNLVFDLYDLTAEERKIVLES